MYLESGQVADNRLAVGKHSVQGLVMEGQLVVVAETLDVEEPELAAGQIHQMHYQTSCCQI